MSWGDRAGIFLALVVVIVRSEWIAQRVAKLEKRGK